MKNITNEDFSLIVKNKLYIIKKKKNLLNHSHNL